MQPATAASVLARFDSAQVSTGGVTSTFFRRGGRYFVNTEGDDGALHDYEIAFTFGVSPLQQYLVASSDGRMQPLPLAWDTRPAAAGGQRWFHLQPGPRITHTDELHWTNHQQNWNYMCADCHSTGLRKNYDAATDSFHTTWSSIDVSCEACHGPASAHTEWARYPAWLRPLLWESDGLPAQLTERRGVRWSIDPATGNVKRNTPRHGNIEVQTCAQCHSRRTQIAGDYTAGSAYFDHYVPSLIVSGLYYADGQQRDEVYNYGSFLQSRMYHAGVTCSDCHNPHSGQLRATGNALCAQCHSAAKYDTPAHHHHVSNNAGAQCVSCHMPAATYMQVDPRRDHSIRIPRPDQTVSLGVPNACSGCHTNQSAQWAAQQVRAWTGRDPSGFQRFGGAFTADERNTAGAADSLGTIAGDTTEPAFVRASALARLHDRPGDVAFRAAQTWSRDTSALVRRSALQILESFPPTQRTSIAAPLLRDRSRAVRIEAAWLLAPAAATLDADARGAFTGASDEFIASQRYNADRPENCTTLGTYFAELGRYPEAEAELRAALTLAPRFPSASANLADVYRAEGKDAEGERVLRDALGRSPNDPQLHYALGLTLVRRGNVPEAVVELQRASTLAPSDEEFAYAYVVALHTVHRDAEARKGADSLAVRFPGQPQIEALLKSLGVGR